MSDYAGVTHARPIRQPHDLHHLYLSIYLFINISGCPSVYLSTYLSVSLYISLFVHQPISLSVHIFIYCQRVKGHMNIS